MSNRLEGKTALVTGGSIGIGLATAKRFAEEGATVYLTGRKQGPLDAAASEIGHGAVALQADSSNLDDLDRVYATIQEQSGTLDVLFVNAGVFEFVPLKAVTEDHYAKMFDTNVKGLLFTVQKALPLMPKGSSIILNGSAVDSKGFPASSVYSATKAAVRSFARTWTTDLKEDGIRVNVVSPGPIDTPGFRSMGETEEQKQQMVDGMTSMVPIGRLGRVDDIANAALFLASDESTFLAGSEISVDGGVAQV